MRLQLPSPRLLDPRSVPPLRWGVVGTGIAGPFVRALHARTGQPCPECGDIVREVSFADTSLQYCATCQTGGKPLADRRMSRLLK